MYRWIPGGHGLIPAVDRRHLVDAAWMGRLTVAVKSPTLAWFRSSSDQFLGRFLDMIGQSSCFQVQPVNFSFSLLNGGIFYRFP